MECDLKTFKYLAVIQFIFAFLYNAFNPYFNFGEYTVSKNTLRIPTMAKFPSELLRSAMRV